MQEDKLEAEYLRQQVESLVKRARLEVSSAEALLLESHLLASRVQLLLFSQRERLGTP